nr:hypothetical protein [Tanacetum cinerariifolium]
MYHKKNVDFGYLMWEDFLYQVEHKDAKKSNEMYYLRFTKVIINFFITKDPSIPRRNKVNWHYVKDDQMFTTIKLVLRHQNTQQFGTMLPFELTNEDIRNSAAYKEYYAIASGAAPPKTKASVRKTTINMTINQQVALDEALDPHASRLRIGKSNFCLRLDITSKESTLLVVYDVLRLTLFYKAFLFTADTFDELLFEEEILTFLRYLGHSGEIKKITNVNINKLHQPWRSFVAVINKCLTGKSTAYKEYYAIASGAVPPKTKASVRKTQSSSDTTMPPPTAVGTRLSTLAKGKQPAKSSKAKGLSLLSEADDDDDDQEDEYEQDDDDQASDNDNDDFVHPKLSTHDKEAKDEESFDPIVQTPSRVEDFDDESNDDESHGMNVGGDKGPDAEDDDEELYRDVNINLKGRDVQMTDVHTIQVLEDTYVTLTPVNPDGIDSLFESTPRVDVPVTTTAVPLPVTAPTLPPPIMFDHRLKTLEANFSKFMQTNRLRDEAQAENEDFINKLDKNIQKIIKEQLKEQVKVQVSKILPKIEKTVNEQLEAEVLTRCSNSSKTSYAMAADLSKMKLKKILIKKMESNKSIRRSDKQRNLYKALVDAYECDKIILDTYKDTVTLKIRRDDVNKDEQPFAGSNRGSKRRREGKEPESTSAPKEKASKTTGKSTEGSKSHQKTCEKQTKPPTPDRAWNKTLSATYESIQPWISDLAKQADSLTSFNELMDTPMDFSAFLMNRLKVNTLTPELLAGLTYELIKGSCKSIVELEFFLEEVYKATTDKLD